MRGGNFVHHWFNPSHTWKISPGKIMQVTISSQNIYKQFLGDKLGMVQYRHSVRIRSIVSTQVAIIVYKTCNPKATDHQTCFLCFRGWVCPPCWSLCGVGYRAIFERPKRGLQQSLKGHGRVVVEDRVSAYWEDHVPCWRPTGADYFLWPCGTHQTVDKTRLNRWTCQSPGNWVFPLKLKLFCSCSAHTHLRLSRLVSPIQYL